MSSKFLDKTGLDTLWAKIKSTFQTLGNLVTTSTGWGSTPSDTKYPSEKLVKTSIDAISTNARTIPQDVSKGVNLVVNGSGTMKSNYNFSTCNYIANTDLPAGVAGCFHKAGLTFFNDEIIAVNTSKTYQLESWYRVKAASTSTVRLSVCCLDIDGKEIQANTICYGVGTLTRLTQDLKNGDTVVHLEDLSGAGWIATEAYQRGFIFWNYKNSLGYQYPPETYSRNCYGTLYENANVNVSAGTITLNSAWNKGTIPAGTYVSRYGSGGTYYYVAYSAASAALTTWTKLSGIAKGFTNPGAANGGAFRPGTAFIKVGWVNANTSGDEWIEFGGIELREITDANSMLSALPEWTANPTDGVKLIRRDTGGSATFGQVTFLTVWNYIKDKISSVLGLTATSYGGNAATATTATTAAGYTSGGAIDTALQGKVDKETGKGLSTNDFTDTYKSSVDSNTSARHTHSNKSVLDDISSTDVANWNAAEPNVQSDWNQTTSTADDYIKNKPTLGTAAAKDVPASGNASTTQVVMGSDSRLSDARPASDVSAWAKAATKPAYTASEVGAVPTSRTVNGKALSSNITLDASDVGSLDGHRVWSGGANSVYGYKVCETADIAHGSSNVYAIAMGTMALTNKYATDPQASTTSARDGSLAFGSFYIWCYGTPDGTLTGKARLFSSNPAFNNTDLALCYRKDGDKMEWFVGFGPLDDPSTASSALTKSRPFGMSVSFDYTQNIVVPDSLDPVPSGKHYDDWYGLFKQPYMLNNANGVGSISQPVYVMPNGQIKACKQLVQAVTSIDTSNMDPDVLYVM